MNGGYRTKTGAEQGLPQVMCEACGTFGLGKPADGALTSVHGECPDCGGTAFRDPYEN